MQISYSNRLELLLEQLKAGLFESSLPFARRLIIVPSPAMKSWLMLQLAKDPTCGIAMGVEISYLDQTLQLFSDCTKPTLTRLELALAIEYEIRNIFSLWKSLSSSQQLLWLSLKEYLKIDSLTNLSQKTERRITTLSHMLASFFTQYGLYGNQMMQAWNEQSGWQQQLWLRLFEKGPWSYPYRDLTASITQTSKEKFSHYQIHVFGLSYLPKLSHTLLNDLSKKIPVHLYFLSPCQAFWSDMVSERGSQRLQEYWRKRGISTAQQMALDEYLRDRNPLLANFGRLGREMAQQIEESSVEVLEEYVLPITVTNHPTYTPFLTDDTLVQETTHELTLLEAVQADLVLLRNPEQSEPVSVRNDRSIQLHVASNRMREIEIISNALLDIIQKHAHTEAPISPSDILVMAPNINDYVPSIEAVFSAPDSPMTAQLMDLPLPSQNPYVQGFLHLLALPESRWNVSAITALLDHPAFQASHQFAGEEVAIIHEWIKATDVRWGTDLAHRNEVLRRNHCLQEMAEINQQGTWEHSFGRLLAGLTLHTTSSEFLPLEKLETTQGALLGRWLEALRSLQADLKCLYDGTCMTLANWSAYLTCLCDAHLKSDSDTARDQLNMHFGNFAKAEQQIGAKEIPFTTISHHLHEALNQEGYSHREHCLHAVRFCSLLPMRAIPAKVIVMIGMEEGAFPKGNQPASLNLLHTYKDADYVPSQTDYDRFLFLEALLSARHYLVLSYQGSASSNGNIQSPSLLVTELMHYLDRGFKIEDALPSICCTQHHPYSSYDKHYFLTDSHLKNYSHKHYQAAQAYYHIEKERYRGFIHSFAIDPSKTMPPPERIAIQQLESFARNPLRSYCNKKLGIYLDPIEKRIAKDEEDLYLTPLQSFLVKKDGLRASIDQHLEIAEKLGQLPTGPFKNSAIQRIKSDLISLKANLEHLGADAQTIFSIHLSEHVEKAQQLENGDWEFPPLMISYGDKQIELVGTIPEVTSKGLVAHAYDSKSDVTKLWPQFLLFTCLIQTHQLPFEPQLLLVKGTQGKAKASFLQNPQDALIDYLNYYFLAKEHASPLIPEWIPSLVNEEPEQISQTIKESLTNPFRPLFNEYAHWIISDDLHASDAHALATHWKPVATRIFGPVYANWWEGKDETV